MLQKARGNSGAQKKQWQKRKRLEEYAPHQDVLASTIMVAASA